MPVFCLGLNHRTAPVALREQLAFTTEQLQTVLEQVGRGVEAGALQELVVLSTCNRMELYAAGKGILQQDLLSLLEAVHQRALTEFQTHFYWLEEKDAARHLFRVAAGLDSLVIGEPQILGQVSQALERARAAGAAGPVLNRLFQAALHAGKRARTETAISRQPASVASLAATQAIQAAGAAQDLHIVVLGAGEMARLTVAALRKRGAEHIWVLNRTLERAEALASQWQGRAASLDALEAALAWADVFIASAGAPHFLVHAEMVARAMRLRPQRPLVMLDIAVPRDVEPAAGHLLNVRLFDIDQLNQRLEVSLAARQREIPRVEAILVEELQDFLAYLRSLDVLPVIAELSAYAEQVRRAEVEKTLRRMPGLSASEQERVDRMSRALVKKLLAPAFRQLRQDAEYAFVLRQLFNLSADVVHSGASLELQENR